jgi:hypothetical protein
MSLHCNSNYIFKLENKILTIIKPFWNYIENLNLIIIQYLIPENMLYNNTTARSSD